MTRHPNNGDRQGKTNLENNTKRPLNNPTANTPKKSKNRKGSNTMNDDPNDLQYQFDVCRDFSEAVDLFQQHNLEALIKLDGLISDVQHDRVLKDFDDGFMIHYDNFKSCIDSSIKKLLDHQDSYDRCASSIINAMNRINSKVQFGNSIKGGMKDLTKEAFSKAKK